MLNMSRRAHHRAVTRVGFGCLLMATSTFLPDTSAAAPRSCAERLERASLRSFAGTLRCSAREKRSGSVDPTCRSRADSFMDKVTRDHTRCSGNMSSALDRIDRCTAAVLAHVPGNGRCAARKVRAAVRSVLRRAGGATLCREFEESGDCAGDCHAVDSALQLEDCWIAPRAQQTLPAAAPDDQVILFGAYEADSISSITIAGQDEETETAEVVIEPGATPLFVILTSYDHVIWRFRGDVSRVDHVVLVGSGSGGVTGIAAERVADMTGASGELSGSFYFSESPEGHAVRQAVEDAIGRPVDVAAGSYSVGTLFLPSATVAPSVTPSGVPPGFDPSLYQLGLWFNPGGVVDVDPSLAVSTTLAEPYEVLPHEFGLAQLVSTGALEKREDYFYITGATTRFPAGLTGSHSVSFVLGTGVPMPAGSPGHSCVVSEETGRPIGDNPICFFSEPPPVTCDFPEAPAADQIVLFGAYEGDAISTVTIAGQDEETETARVVIGEGASRLYVVLTAYGNMIWRFEGNTERIDRVVLGGYGAQGVEGLPQALVSDFSGAAGCLGYFYDPQSPEAVAIRSALEDAVGRNVDVLAGAYSVGTLSLPSATVAGSVAPPSVAPGFDPDVYQLGLRFNPGGLVEIDPALVVSSQPAEPYEVLPQGFGLSQLVATGALEHLGNQFLLDSFRIASAIPRFPSGLYGAHSVTFVLGSGVPLPAGSPGHSCVVSEETGLPVGNEFLCSFAFPG